MNDFLMNLLYINLGISILILTIIIIRKIFSNRIHIGVLCFVWLLVFVRMIVPIQIENNYSLMSSSYI